MFKTMKTKIAAMMMIFPLAATAAAALRNKQKTTTKTTLSYLVSLLHLAGFFFQATTLLHCLVMKVIKKTSNFYRFFRSIYQQATQTFYIHHRYKVFWNMCKSTVPSTLCCHSLYDIPFW
jgi:hypothetical protein